MSHKQKSLATSTKNAHLFKGETIIINNSIFSHLNLVQNLYYSFSLPPKIYATWLVENSAALTVLYSTIWILYSESESICLKCKEKYSSVLHWRCVIRRNRKIAINLIVIGKWLKVIILLCFYNRLKRAFFLNNNQVFEIWKVYQISIFKILALPSKTYFFLSNNLASYYGSTLEPFVFQLNMAFVSRIEASI